MHGNVTALRKLSPTSSNFLRVSTLPSLHVCLASPPAQPSIVLLPFVIQLTPHHRRPTLVFSDVLPILSRRSYLPPQLATFYFVSSPCVTRTPWAMGCGCSLCIAMTNGTEAVTAWRRSFSADCLNSLSHKKKKKSHQGKSFWEFPLVAQVVPTISRRKLSHCVSVWTFTWSLMWLCLRLLF